MSDSDSEWVPVQKVRNYELVMAQLEDQLLSGRLKSGDHLPSERVLASRLGISRPSLREVLRVLEALGIVEVKLGGGPASGTVIRDQPGSAYGRLMRMELAMGHFSRNDILLSRLALEEWSFLHAARSANAEDIEELSALVTQMDDAEISIERYMEIDSDFHALVADIAGNKLNAHILRSFRNAIHLHMISQYEKLDDWRTEQRRLNEEHRAMLSAIENRDAELARSLIHASITNFYIVDLPYAREDEK